MSGSSGMRFSLHGTGGRWQLVGLIANDPHYLTCMAGVYRDYFQSSCMAFRSLNAYRRPRRSAVAPMKGPPRFCRQCSFDPVANWRKSTVFRGAWIKKQQRDSSGPQLAARQDELRG